jgi:hypothetical protein
MDREALKKKTVAELREEAKAIPEAKGLSSMKKDELIELILSHAGGGAPAPKKSLDKAAKGTTLDRSAIKQRIRALKEEKHDALSKDDRQRAKACNRQIHDYKRLLRKMSRGTSRKSK